MTSSRRVSQLRDRDDSRVAPSWRSVQCGTSIQPVDRPCVPQVGNILHAKKGRGNTQVGLCRVCPIPAFCAVHTQRPITALLYKRLPMCNVSIYVESGARSGSAQMVYERLKQYSEASGILYLIYLLCQQRICNLHTRFKPNDTPKESV